MSVLTFQVEQGRRRLEAWWVVLGGVMHQAEEAASVFCVISEKTPNIVTVRAVAGRQATVRVCPCPCLLSV